MKGLVLDSVSITAGNDEEPLFPALSFTVGPGCVTTIVGPSGIGKSTLMDLIGGHLSRGFRADGRILLDGHDLMGLPAEARRVGIMFQDPVLFPHLSVGDNLAFGLAARHRGRARRRAIVEESLAQAALHGLYERDPATLSGGQRARAALMRTLLAEPRALLLDEPFSKLDPALRDEVRGFVFIHVRKQAIPVLMVTHDQDDATAAAGDIIRLD